MRGIKQHWAEFTGEAREQRRAEAMDEFSRKVDTIRTEIDRLRAVEKLSRAVVTLAFSNDHLDQEAPMWNALHALRAALGKEG